MNKTESEIEHSLVVEDAPIRAKDLLSTGSTLLNLACSGTPFGGFLKGHYYLLVGDSDSGKTFFSMTCMAEATINPQFKDYRLIYDNIEDGMLMDLESLFNEQMADRIEPPAVVDGEPAYSSTIEEFYYHVDDANKEGRPFIYILDSMDGLLSEASDAKFDKKKAAHNKEKSRKEDDDEPTEKVAGSYGDGKAKINSESLRKVIAGLRKSGSILIIISQTRDNLGFGFEKKTRSGGRALAFYATMQIWTSIAGKIRPDIQGKRRDIGSTIQLEVKRNRLTGKRTMVQTDIYPSVGIDDIGSCIDYLVDEKYWPMQKQTITAKGLDLVGTREKLIKLIERRSLEDDLRSICGVCWKEIDAACSLVRKNRYAPKEGE